MGKFHGTIRPTTPTGSWKVTLTPPGTGICLPAQALRAPPSSSAGRPVRCPASHRAWPTGCPLPATSRPASSSIWASTASAKARSSAARSPGATARQAAWAATARVIAASVSSADVDGTVATVSSVAGFSTANVDMRA